jgi:non-heme chloroperoxidase
MGSPRRGRFDRVGAVAPGRRGIIEGEKDHRVAWAIAKAAYKRRWRNPGVTEFVKMANRGHSLTIDHGWREVAQAALDFVKRFV